MTEEATNLEDLDPIFATPVGAVGAGAPKTEESATPPAVDTTTATLLGAGAGAMAPKMPTQSDTQVRTAQARAKAATAGAQSAQKSLLSQATAHDTQISKLQNTLKAVQATHAQNISEYMHLHDLATRAGVPIEMPSSLAPTSGDVWSKKVVGSMGPGGEGVTEAARNYRMQQGLTPEESSKFTVNRQGIIEPNTKMPATASMKTDLLKRVKEAEQRALQSSQELAKHQGMLDSMLKKHPVSPQRSGSVANRVAKAEEAKAFADELMRANKGASVARIFSKVPGILSGAGTGYEAAQAINALRQGDIKGAVLPGISALGGALAMVPTPITKAIGYPMQMAPLAYEAYQALTEEEQPGGAGTQPLPSMER